MSVVEHIQLEVKERGPTLLHVRGAAVVEIVRKPKKQESRWQRCMRWLYEL